MILLSQVSEAQVRSKTGGRRTLSTSRLVIYLKELGLQGEKLPNYLQFRHIRA